MYFSVNTSYKEHMNSIRVLDVTLRDGGCVNNFNFGHIYMDKILSALEKGRLDIIEVGYIDEKKGSEKGRTQYINEKVIYNNFLTDKKGETEYVAMIDYPKFDVDKLEIKHSKGIDGIRIAFHKKDRLNVVPFCKTILDKGYHLYIQPMTIMRYTDSELLEFIEIVNKELGDASAFYIVDSFGEMRMNDMQRVLNLVDHNLKKDMTIGFHSHNNLQLSYSNAVSMLQFPMNRDIIIDASLVGMGKGAGNLNTELFLEHLNLYYKKNYQLAPLLEVIDNVINQVKEEFHWGYSVEYYLSSANHCTPSYASYFYNKHMLKIDQVAELLSEIAEEKKISFDEKYAEELYREYNIKNFDDTDTVEEIKQIFKNKKICLIAPGKSIEKYKSEIERYLDDPEYICISMNILNLEKVNYVLISRQEVSDLAQNVSSRLLVTSNIVYNGKAKVDILDYKKWISVIEGETYDSAGFIILNLLEQCDVKEVIMAGFDGYKSDITENYFDITFRRPVTSSQAQKRNEVYKKWLDSKQALNIKVITPSLYME